MANPFTVHLNGSGKVATGATVAQKAFIGEDCVVLDACEVYGESVIRKGSQLSGACRVFGGADIQKSRLHGSVIVAGEKAAVINSLLIGDILVADSASVHSCDLRCGPGQIIRITEKRATDGSFDLWTADRQG